MSSPASLKRTYDEAALEQMPEAGQQQSTIHPTISSQISTDSHTQLSNQMPSNSSIPIAHKPDDSQKVNKKPKLTAAEREEKEVERRLKEQQRAEERAKKEEERQRKEREKAEKEAEKAQKAEERRAKEDERKKLKEERDRLKEEEKVKRDDEKQKREEEKSKKERSQLRLNAFFGQSAGTRSSTASPAPEARSQSASRRNSIAGEEATSTSPQKPRVSDFEQAFPSFFVHANVSLAPINRFSRDEDAVNCLQRNLDQSLSQLRSAYEHNAKRRFEDALCLPPHKRQRRFTPTISVKQIVANIEGAAQNPIILSDDDHQAKKSTDSLKSVSLKFLKFREDVRPPYIGTYSKVTDPSIKTRLSRKPCSRNLPKVNYDYDSEAEWEDPGEGEDLLSEGEEEPDDEDDGDMEGFLDDEETTDGASTKRRPLLGALEPVSSGLCWTEDADGPDLSSYRIDMLTGQAYTTCEQEAQLTQTIEDPCFPIDPYTTVYWHQPTPIKPSTSTAPDQTTLMQPPRIPLNPITGQAIAKPSSVQTNSKPPKRLIPNDLMDEFKSAVQGSDLTKLGLVEQLKKKFPKQSKDIIRDSLDAIAQRVGDKIADKKWVLKSSG